MQEPIGQLAKTIIASILRLPYYIDMFSTSPPAERHAACPLTFIVLAPRVAREGLLPDTVRLPVAA